MKLRNKKTGEIRNCQLMADGFIVINSLKDLEEWEDYEEPKGIRSTTASYKYNRIIIGFYSKQETVKAYEKLKAWKRLEDKGFRFKGKKLDPKTYKHYIEFEVCSKDVILFSEDIDKDLDLLFGGKK